MVAAEISVTGRTYARCVAEVTPAWIEHAAGHLVKRSHSEPRWDSKRGEAMVNEQVTLYGLVLASQRPKRAVEVDRAAAREIFAFNALVGDDERAHAAFMNHNRELVEQVEELCAKGRRAGLMASESKRARFYLDRLPEEVCSIRSFNAFVRSASAEDVARLHMTEADLLGDSAATVDDRDYPMLLRVGDKDLRLAYKFAPGEPDDGVSIQVDSGSLMQLDRNALDWLVPGFFEEKCLALGRALPKSLRRQLLPLVDTIRVVHERLRQPEAYRQGGLADALSETVRACHGIAIPPDAWRMRDLPAHLCMNIQLRDGRRRRVLDQDRDLDALRNRHRAHVAKNLTIDLRRSLERRDLTAFPDSGVPDSLVLGGGHSVVYPVLVDRGNGVDLLVQAAPGGRTELNRDGYTRLAMLAEPRTARELRREVEHDAEMMINCVPLGSPASFADSLVACAFWHAYFDGSELPRTRPEFDSCARAGSAALRGTFSKILVHARGILAKRTALARALDGLTSPAYAQSRDDMAHQLAGLVAPDFLRRTSCHRLPDLPRYLEALAYRIDNLQGRVRRDLAGLEKVAAWERRLQAVAEQADDTESDSIEELRFLLEEYRIATFAQGLGTRERVSDKRLAQRFDTAISSLRTP